VYGLLGMNALSTIGVGFNVSKSSFQSGLGLSDPIDDSIKPNDHVLLVLTKKMFLINALSWIHNVQRLHLYCRYK